ncbi:hypothetical protein PR048_025828 [Dryococelus australis]|uniref:Uncharacterized protein n=1 Tax=Dryococelus australis TaxID=614101 RepID=A0ABQ9GJJ6_9NEOP|nr:hypothetical protein PR048_025828 [Dryococelus australis]
MEQEYAMSKHVQAVHGKLSTSERPAEDLLCVWTRGGVVVRLLASHLGELGYTPGESLTDFRSWETCRTMTLVGGFSWGSPVSLGLVSPSSALKNSMSRTWAVLYAQCGVGAAIGWLAWWRDSCFASGVFQWLFDYWSSSHQSKDEVDRYRWLRKTNLRVPTQNCFSASTPSENNDWGKSVVTCVEDEQAVYLIFSLRTTPLHVIVRMVIGGLTAVDVVWTFRNEVGNTGAGTHRQSWKQSPVEITRIRARAQRRMVPYYMLPEVGNTGAGTHWQSWKQSPVEITRIRARAQRRMVPYYMLPCSGQLRLATLALARTGKAGNSRRLKSHVYGRELSVEWCRTTCYRVRANVRRSEPSIKLGPGSKLGLFDLGSGKLLQPGISREQWSALAAGVSQRPEVVAWESACPAWLRAVIVSDAAYRTGAILPAMTSTWEVTPTHCRAGGSNCSTVDGDVVVPLRRALLVVEPQRVQNLVHDYAVVDTARRLQVDDLSAAPLTHVGPAAGAVAAEHHVISVRLLVRPEAQACLLVVLFDGAVDHFHLLFRCNHQSVRGISFGTKATRWQYEVLIYTGRKFLPALKVTASRRGSPPVTRGCAESTL